MDAHEMDFVGPDSSGNDEWRCNACGRVVLVSWWPAERIVISAGDPAAMHVGGRSAESVSAGDLAWLDRHGIAWD